MSSWQKRIQIQVEPNIYREAIHLLQSWVRWKDKTSTGQQDEVPFTEVHLLDEVEMDTESREKFNRRNADLFRFVGQCRAEGEPFLAELAPLLPLMTLKSPEATEEFGFLIEVLATAEVKSVQDLRREDLMKAMLMVILYYSDLEEKEDERFLALSRMLMRGELPLGEVLGLLSQSYYEDSAQLQILRLFQDKEPWFEAVRNIMVKLENIIRKNWSLVSVRFEEKIRSLHEGDGLSRELRVTEQLIGRLEGMRSDDTITLWIIVLGFNVLEIRLSHFREVPPRIISGILVQDLEDFKDRRRSRDNRLQQQLKALADPTRFKVMQQLAQRPQFVLELATALELTSATLSHHLSVLQQAFLVRTSIEGRRAYYSLNGGELKELAEYIDSLSRSPGSEDGESEDP